MEFPVLEYMDPEQMKDKNVRNDFFKIFKLVNSEFSWD